MDPQQMQRLEMTLGRMLRGMKIGIERDARATIQALQARHEEPLSLVPFGFKAYSQNDEDGMIAEIFRRIGATRRTFVETLEQLNTQIDLYLVHIFYDLFIIVWGCRHQNMGLVLNNEL